MLPLYFGIYIFILAILWGFFLVARHHTYKFQDFSTSIKPVTRTLFVFLITLSILGFFLLFTLGGSTKFIEIDTTKPAPTTYY